MKHIFKDDIILALATNRLGSVSTNEYKSLNLGFHVGDSDINVTKNYELLCNDLNISSAQIYLLNQTHSANLVKITKDSPKISIDADASYTKEKQVYLGILTADCLPILLYDKTSGIVAGIHAGWLGSTRLITYKTIEYLKNEENLNPTTTEVFIGPSIFKEVYEVGLDVYNKACQHRFLEAQSCFSKIANEKYLFDNRLYNQKQLLECGILLDNITHLSECTYQNNDYFSYRRDGITGRQLSLIGLK